MHRRANWHSSLTIILRVLGLVLVAALPAGAEAPGAKTKIKEPPVIQKSTRPRSGAPVFRDKMPPPQPKAHMEGPDVPYSGDLRVGRISLDKAEYAPGERVDARIFLENTGNLSARFAVETHLVADPSQLGPGTRIDRTTMNIRAAGSGSFTARANLPLGGPAPPRFVVVVIDVENEVDEQDEGNNQRSEAFEIRREGVMLGQRPGLDLERDLSVDQLELHDAILRRGDRVRVDFQITNHSDAVVLEVPYGIYLGRSTNGVFNYSMPAMDSGMARDIPPRGHASMSRLFTMPSRSDFCGNKNLFVAIDGRPSRDEAQTASAPIFVHCE